MIIVKRVYEEANNKDGTRVLADRLWPRGVSRERARIEVWAKELTPSTELRQWYHVNPEERFVEFVQKYERELETEKEVARKLTLEHKNITLVTAVSDIPHSHIPTLKAFLQSI